MARMPIWVLLLMMSAAVPALEGTVIERAKGSTKAPYGFVEFLPKGYDASADKRWPLVVFLHGAGENGDGNKDLVHMKGRGPLKAILAGMDLPAVVITPQAEQWFWYGTVGDFITACQAMYRIDEQKISLTGYSAGGKVTWDCANADPQRFAAVVPICGLYQDNEKKNPLDPARLVGLPVWAFHNYDDTTVGRDNSIRWLDGIAAAIAYGPSPVMAAYVGNDQQRPEAATATLAVDGTWQWRPVASAPLAAKVLFTVYARGGHDAWTRTYALPAMWEWLLAQSRPPATRK